MKCPLKKKHRTHIGICLCPSQDMDGHVQGVWQTQLPLWRHFCFGFAEFIREDVGEKTLIKPRGTYFYMSKEMKNANNLDQSSLIDLYDNDLFCPRTHFRNT